MEERGVRWWILGGGMKERGEYCYNVFKETQNFRRVFHEIPHSFEVKFVFYSFQVPLWQCLWLSLFTRFFEVQRVVRSHSKSSVRSQN
jgi:hypothetical protein